MHIKSLIGLALTSAALGLGISSVNSNQAQAKTTGTTPTAIRGTFYRYNGAHTWSKIKVAAHSAYIQNPGESVFKITSTSKSNSHKLAYSGKLTGKKYFTLQATIKASYLSPFPELGFRLTSRKIKGHSYKVLRGYQGGYGFDYIKGKKVSRDYSHQADGTY